MKTTTWYPHTIKPVRAGVYLTRHRFSSGYAYWTGRDWSVSRSTFADAIADRGWVSMYQDRQWRGLVSDPKAKP